MVSFQGAFIVQTELLRPDDDAMPGASIARAADVLRGGGLVAFATETVYGLGGVATDPSAVARIFAAKGRPATNPVIVHVADIAAARNLVLNWPPRAQRLAERFWPGPLTLVLPRGAGLPDLVTAGGSTVAVRVPAHPVALALMRAVGLPIAAPSANRSQRLSPTTADHVMKQLAGRIEMVLDSGPTSGGLESTVLDLSTDRPRLLRPGLLSLADLEAFLEERVLLGQQPGDSPIARSPGQQARHYAPSVPLKLREKASQQPLELSTSPGQLVGWLSFGAVEGADRAHLCTVAMPVGPAEYAARLYAALHELEAAGVSSIVVDAPPDLPAWQAVRDRLRRAAAVEGPTDHQ
ncbi:MAG: L-threonylcarbamoyladenylate synthase [Pirellulales bacterium]